MGIHNLSVNKMGWVLAASSALLLLFFTTDQIYAVKPDNNPTGKCNQPVNIYENIKCNGVYSKNEKRSQGCPNCYNCSQINPDINECYYQGKYYAIDESLEEGANLPTCYALATCTSDLTFVYAIYDCAVLEKPDECYYTFSLTSCCPTGYNCNTSETHVCNIDGQEFLDGERFRNPKDKCSTCVCTPGMTGAPNDPNCRKDVCEVELTQSNYILAYCAPVYFRPDDCCPQEYICPRDDDKFPIKESDSSDSSDSKSSEAANNCQTKNDCKKCRYGKQSHEIGTKFSRTEKLDWVDGDVITECECVIPPYFTCFRK